MRLEDGDNRELSAGKPKYMKETDSVSICILFTENNKSAIHSWFSALSSREISVGPDKTKLRPKMDCVLYKTSWAKTSHQKLCSSLEFIATAEDHKYLSGIKKVKYVGVIESASWKYCWNTTSEDYSARWKSQRKHKWPLQQQTSLKMSPTILFVLHNEPH